MRTFPILMYHNIAVPKAGHRLTSHFTSPGQFYRQMKLMKLLGYRGLSISELLPHIQSDSQEKVFGITFDDGYEDNFAHALPVLQDLSFTATCYVVAGHVGEVNAWTKGLPSFLMTEGQLHQWAKGGMEVGAHTQNHEHLTKIPLDQARQEIRECRSHLQTLLNCPVTAFSYPYGEYSQDVRRMVEEEGFTSATTTERRRAVQGDDPLLLPRVHMTRRSTLFLMLTKCFTPYEERFGV